MTAYRWSASSSSFLSPRLLGGSGNGPLTASARVQSHERVYLGYANGEITYLDSGTGTEHLLTKLDSGIRELADAGDFIYVRTDTSSYRPYSKDGAEIIGRGPSFYPLKLDAPVYDPARHRIYFIVPRVTVDLLSYVELDHDTAQVVASDQWVAGRHYGDATPIIPSPAGDVILTGSGGLFDAEDLSFTEALPGNIAAGLWTTADGLVVAREQRHETLLDRLDPDYRAVETRTYAGAPLALLKSDDGYILVTLLDEHASIYSYRPSDDSDADGVTNTLDAFPEDSAASVDTDGDGYPDFWNSGSTEGDSTTGLLIDAYPNDSQCYLPEHGDGANCDVAAAPPGYMPDGITVDSDGTAYLLSTEHGRIFRYAARTDATEPSIVVGRSSWSNGMPPTVIEYAPSHDRVYLGYSSGTISYVDMRDAGLQEKRFASIEGAVTHLSAAGDFLMAFGAGDRWGQRYYFDSAGVVTGLVEGLSNDASPDYAWNESLHRNYYFQLLNVGFAPHLGYDQLDDRGAVIGTDSPHYEEAATTIPPLLMSPDDEHVLLGNGNIFTAANLVYESRLTSAFVSGVWNREGQIVTAHDLGGITRIDRYDASRAWVGAEYHDGEPLALYETADGYVLVAHDGHKPIFTMIAR